MFNVRSLLCYNQVQQSTSTMLQDTGQLAEAVK